MLPITFIDFQILQDTIYIRYWVFREYILQSCCRASCSHHREEILLVATLLLSLFMEDINMINLPCSATPIGGVVNLWCNSQYCNYFMIITLVYGNIHAHWNVQQSFDHNGLPTESSYHLLVARLFLHVCDFSNPHKGRQGCWRSVSN